MTNHRSAGSFCSIVVGSEHGTSNSVESLDVAALGAGAECFCLAAAAAYRYDSGSTQGNIVGTNAFIVPLAGGGCWIKQNAQRDYAQSVIGGANFVTNVTPALQRRWAHLPQAAGAYTVPTNPSSPLWTVDGLTGAIVFNGRSGQLCLLTAQISVESASVHQLEFDLQTNGNLAGTTTDTATAIQAQALAAGTVFSLSSFVIATNGDAYQYVFRDLQAPPLACTFVHLQVQIISISP